MNFILRNKYRALWLSPLPIFPDDSKHDLINPETKTYQSYVRSRIYSKETGWQRIKDIFSLDEFGDISPELNSIYQAGFIGMLFGVVYGGFINSRYTYMTFMENNQASAFKSPLDAKRKLQDQITVNFAKGAFRWGWRLGLFTTSYCGMVTLISAYRGKSSIFDYLGAGMFTGAAYKINMGLRGMVAGGVAGGVLGTLSGAVSLLLLYSTGTTTQDLRYWQYKWKMQRDEAVEKAYRKADEQDNPTPELIKLHDAQVDNTDLNKVN